MRTLIWRWLAKKSRALAGASLRTCGIEVTRRVVARSEPVPKIRQVEAALENRTLADSSLGGERLVAAVVM